MEGFYALRATADETCEAKRRGRCDSFFDFVAWSLFRVSVLGHRFVEVEEGLGDGDGDGDGGGGGGGQVDGVVSF